MDVCVRIIIALCCLALAACSEIAPQSRSVPVLSPTLSFEMEPEARPVPNLAPSVVYRLQAVAAVRTQPQPAESEEAEQTPQLADTGANGAIPTSAVFTKGEFLGAAFNPGSFEKRTWFAGENFYGSAIPTPVLVANGLEDGPTLCLTAAIHGDELNGIETVRRVLHDLNVEKLKGRVIGVPIVNLQGFQRNSRYLPDRRDLNRFFPGIQQGSSAARMAFSLFREVIMHCDGLVDLHTGSFHRTNLPQLRADLNNPAVVELTQGFGSTVILHSEGAEGTLRHAATAAGIPAVTLEAGEPLRIDEESVKHSVKGIFTLLDTMGMYDRRSLWGNPEPVYYTATWLRSDVGGILVSSTKLGRKVEEGELLGTVTDPITNEMSEVRSPVTGRVIGMALNQFVMPGYAVYHIGLAAPVKEAIESEPNIEIDHSLAQVDRAEEREEHE